MVTWHRKLSDIVSYGKPYLLKATADKMGVPIPDAFVIRIHKHVQGSVSLPNEDGELIAFGNACTHMGCLLISDGDNDQHNIHYAEPTPNSPEKVVCGPCVCHGTTFDLTKAGLVILGPATQHLPQLALEIAGDEVIAKDWRHGVVDPREERWPMSITGANHE